MKRAYEARGWSKAYHTRYARARGTAALVPELERGGREADAAQLSEDDRRGAGSTLSQNGLSQNGYGPHTHTQRGL